MKRGLLFLVLTVLLLVGFVTASLIWWGEDTKPVSSDETLENFIITKGSSATQIGNKLYSQGLIRSPLAYKIYVQITDNTKNIKAGEYRISASLSLFEVVDKLTKGPVGLWVTIPEGLRREEVVDRFIEALEMDTSRASEFRSDFLDESGGSEGFLFPDTYLFPKDTTASLAYTVLRNTFKSKVETALAEQVSENSLSLNEIISLASLVERETRGEEERPIVAGILLKRLKASWPLQVDATVQYALASSKCNIDSCSNWWPVLTKEDLDLDSPYNTYKFSGLPPLPIANPGLSSIKAVLSPQESSYWYYIHDSEGKIHFASTLIEHNENIREFLGK